MRRMFLALATLSVASTACAQQPTPQAKEAKEADPTRTVTATTTPAGWTVRLDDKDTTRYKVTDTRFETMGTGLHVTSGPAAIYYKDDVKNLSGVSATFVQMEAPRHAEAYGLFFAGRDLGDPAKQTYVYFIVRGDGQYNISQRAGSEVHRIVPWTPSDAVARQDSAGKARNALSVTVGADSVRFLANGKQVQAISRQEITNADGVAGLRVNHNLNVHVDGFTVTTR
ncbi:MAG: hypothetical protein ACYC3Q_00325 [Gemmatimonadaceae bacterium]